MGTIMNQPHNLRRCMGYTLVEISLACFILAIGLVSILSIFPVALKWGDQGVNQTGAAFAARSALTFLTATANPDAGGPGLGRSAGIQTTAASLIYFDTISPYYYACDYVTPNATTTFTVAGTTYYNALRNITIYVYRTDPADTDVFDAAQDTLFVTQTSIMSYNVDP